MAAPSQVDILVAWELSWYRYRVDLGDAGEAVVLLDKGEELDELESRAARLERPGVRRMARLALGVGSRAVIYCVVPQALADELYDKLVDYYKDDPNVKVIIDRREGADRRSGADAPEGEQRDAARPAPLAAHRAPLPPTHPAQ